MGSLNPIVITPGAIAERGTLIAQGLAVSLTASAGQLCTKPGLVLTIADPGTDAFVEELTAAVAAQEPVPMLSTHLRTAFATQAACSVRLPGAATPLAPHASSESTSQAPILVTVDSATFRANPELAREHFGPFAVVVVCRDEADLVAVLREQTGSLTGTVHTGSTELDLESMLARELSRFSGRVVRNGFPTGVQVGWATVHGGPYPATTAANSTSVGMTAVRRFLRPVAWQNMPDSVLPPELRDQNPLGLTRLINGSATTSPVSRFVVE
jgi:NADP-dependent aldehyde dehydrogenase